MNTCLLKKTIILIALSNPLISETISLGASASGGNIDSKKVNISFSTSLDEFRVRMTYTNYSSEGSAPRRIGLCSVSKNYNKKHKLTMSHSFDSARLIDSLSEYKYEYQVDTILSSIDVGFGAFYSKQTPGTDGTSSIEQLNQSLRVTFKKNWGDNQYGILNNSFFSTSFKKNYSYVFSNKLKLFNKLSDNLSLVYAVNYIHDSHPILKVKKDDYIQNLNLKFSF